MKPIDLSNMRVIDLSQNWDVNTPSFATYEGPTVKWIKRPAFEKVGGQFISSTLHVGTHLDAPLHFITRRAYASNRAISGWCIPATTNTIKATGTANASQTRSVISICTLDPRMSSSIGR